MYAKIAAISALAAFASARPNINARQENNGTSNGVAVDTASTDSSPPSYAGSSDGSLTIPEPIVVPDDVKEAAAALNGKLAKDIDAEVTNVDRFNKLLTVNGDGKALLEGETLEDRVVFNFNKAPAQGKGGRFLLANVKSFPILDKQGLATAVGFLNPCGMNSPHIHPRAAEFLTVVQGNITAGFILENGFVDPDGKEGRALASEVQYSVGPFEGTLFPQGSIHYQFNDNCDSATFVATLNSEDPGTSQVAQNLFFLDDKIVDIVLGDNIQIDGSNIAEFRDSLPANLVQAVDSCLSRCSN